jgi:DNA-binding MarR family transcriptional regulator
MIGLKDADYQSLANFRYELRKFDRYSEAAAREAGLTPRQHQALLAIRAGPEASLHVGDVAERLLLRPHSASELVDRMEAQGLVRREADAQDRRQVTLHLTERSETLLEQLSRSHRTELRRMRPLLQELLARLS